MEKIIWYENKEAEETVRKGHSGLVRKALMAFIVIGGMTIGSCYAAKKVIDFCSRETPKTVSYQKNMNLEEDILLS